MNKKIAILTAPLRKLWIWVKKFWAWVKPIEQDAFYKYVWSPVLISGILLYFAYYYGTQYVAKVNYTFEQKLEAYKAEIIEGRPKVKVSFTAPIELISKQNPIKSSFELDIISQVKRKNNQLIGENTYVIEVFNEGSAPAEELAIDLCMITNNTIQGVKDVYDPASLSELVAVKKEEGQYFYERLYYLPPQCMIQHEISFVGKIANAQYNYSVYSKKNIWETKKSEISINNGEIKIHKEKRSLISHFSNAFAGQEEKEDQNALRSGIYIAGYDLLHMTNGIFILAKKKELISKDDALEIKNITESYKEGLLLGGINIIKFNELLINKLIKNKAITYEQAKNAIDESKKQEGTLIGGYNILVLNVQILTALFNNGKIEIKDGQK